MKKIVFIGPAGGGKIPTNGASAKNYHLLKRLTELNYSVTVIDSEFWKRDPRVLLRVLVAILFRRKNRFIVAANNMSSYRLLQLLTLAGIKDVIYWVIGGTIGDWMKKGKVDKKYFHCVSCFLVEGNKMKSALESVGFKNVRYVPNFKDIHYYPLKKEKPNEVLRFVFISRIIPEKGVNLIFEAVSNLNNRYAARFSVDFYGPVEEAFEADFNEKCASYGNVAYRGFLDLTDERNYDVLASYDVMLFPSYWHGEGFPGIMIDALVAGLPIIASNHNLNAELVDDGVTGCIIPTKDVAALSTAMERFITNEIDCAAMSKACMDRAHLYSTRHVIDAQLLTGIGL